MDHGWKDMKLDIYSIFHQDIQNSRYQMLSYTSSTSNGMVQGQVLKNALAQKRSATLPRKMAAMREMLLLGNDCQCGCEQWLHTYARACIVLILLLFIPNFSRRPPTLLLLHICTMQNSAQKQARPDCQKTPDSFLHWLLHYWNGTREFSGRIKRFGNFHHASIKTSKQNPIALGMDDASSFLDSRTLSCHTTHSMSLCRSPFL